MVRGRLHSVPNLTQPDPLELPCATWGKGLGTLHTLTCAGSGENCLYLVGVSHCFAKALDLLQLPKSSGSALHLFINGIHSTSTVFI